MRAKWVIFFVSVAVLGLMLGCAGGNEIKIGVAASLSGPSAKQGQGIVNGVSIAVDRWNAEGGVNGKQIVLIQKDDQENPDVAVEVANAMIQEKVCLVIGHLDSSCSLSASEIYKEAGIVMVTPGSTNPQVTDREGFNNVFRLCGRDDHQGKAAAVYLMNLQVGVEEPAKVAVVRDGTTYGDGLADQFKKFYELLSNQQVGLEEGITREMEDYTALVAAIKEGESDYLYFGGVYNDAVRLLSAMREAELETILVTGDGCFDPELIALAGAEVAEGVIVTFPKSPDQCPRLDQFLADYRKQFGEPTTYSLNAYEAANIAHHSPRGSAGSQFC